MSEVSLLNVLGIFSLIECSLNIFWFVLKNKMLNLYNISLWKFHNSFTATISHENYSGHRRTNRRLKVPTPKLLSALILLNRPTHVYLFPGGFSIDCHDVAGETVSAHRVRSMQILASLPACSPPPPGGSIWWKSQVHTNWGVLGVPLENINFLGEQLWTYPAHVRRSLSWRVNLDPPLLHFFQTKVTDDFSIKMSGKLKMWKVKFRYILSC